MKRLGAESFVLRPEQVGGAVEMCVRNAEDFVLDARALFAAGRMEHIPISCQFALEEAGKAVLLWKASDFGTESVTVPRTELTNHRGKAAHTIDIVRPTRLKSLGLYMLLAPKKSSGTLNNVIEMVLDHVEQVLEGTEAERFRCNYVDLDSDGDPLIGHGLSDKELDQRIRLVGAAVRRVREKLLEVTAGIQGAYKLFSSAVE